MSLKIYTQTQPWQGFAEAYVRVRKNEGRFLSDQDVARLPLFFGDKNLSAEWKMRAYSSKRLLTYLTQKHAIDCTILDVGCGNGWLSNKLALAGFQVIGVDVNLPELEQASRVFLHKNISFAFANIFEWKPSIKFDFVVINASLQYFSAPKQLFKRLFHINPTLKHIYILDTPFYTNQEKLHAKKRSEKYYEKHGEASMAEHYHHFTVEDLGPNAKIIYKPPHKFIRKLIGGSPFPIIEVTSSN